MYIIVPLRSLGNVNIRQEEVFLVWVLSQYGFVTYTKSRAYLFEEFYCQWLKNTFFIEDILTCPEKIYLIQQRRHTAMESQ